MGKDFHAFFFFRYPTGKQDKPPPTVNLRLPKASLVATSAILVSALQT